MIILRLVTARFSKTMCKWVATLCVYMISGKWMQCASNLVTHYTMLILFRLQLVITRRTQQFTDLAFSHLSLQWFFMDLILFFQKPFNPVDWINEYFHHIKLLCALVYFLVVYIIFVTSVSIAWIPMVCTPIFEISSV